MDQKIASPTNPNPNPSPSPNPNPNPNPNHNPNPDPSSNPNPHPNPNQADQKTAMRLLSKRFNLVEPTIATFGWKFLFFKLHGNQVRCGEI